MIAEGSLLFGWTPDECLKMKCRTFFRVLREGRKLSELLKIKNYQELISITVCGNASGEYITKMQEYYSMKYRELYFGEEFKPHNPFVLDAASPEAGRQLLAIGKLKMKTMGLH